MIRATRQPPTVRPPGFFSTASVTQAPGVKFGALRQVPVDGSIQLGDGGMGVSTLAEGFLKVRRGMLFGTVFYLFSPKDITGTPSFFPSLSGRPALVNSSTDQFLAQAGTSLDTGLSWLRPSLAYRIEGVPTDDVFGVSNGFRRPGTVGFIEPGVQLAHGKHSFSFSVPIRTYVNIPSKDSPVSVRTEDATVPDFVIVAGYSVRF